MRIVGGIFRSRLLDAPKGHATRPTSDRAREALFSILGDIEGQRVVDAFAGTGALGLEALSRGAASVVFIEPAKTALDSLHKNIESLKVGAQSRVIAKPALAAVKQIESERFDLILCDPPWVDVPGLKTTLDGLACLMEPNCILVLEHAKRTAIPAIQGRGGLLRVTDSRTYGDANLTFFAPSDVKS